MKKKKSFCCPCEYELKKQETIPEVDSMGYVLRHKKSGAKILVLENEDDNKVFSIGFRTPPKDSTGVAHIIEHTVLCGSKKFPAKDPFIELAKGSLNTFLNAMTYPDKTLFPIASCNDKDFQNLMHVYLDAVFYPNIYQEEKIFRQEGWRYELDTEDGEISYNGVVYNEMKGSYSSAEQKIVHEIEKALYPEAVYGLESGGDPEEIPNLTYKDFLEFHKKYYHPSNSYIYLYGDMNIEEKLQWLDREYLSAFDMQVVDSEIKMQQPFCVMRHAESVYPVTQGETLDQKTYLAYAAVVDTNLNKELYLAFQVLEYLLLDAPGAPLHKALMDAGLGRDVLNYYEKEILQPTFAIILKETEPEQAELFLEVLRSTLTGLIETGISENSLRAAINLFEFRYREADFGRFPKGLMYGIQMMDSWLYDDEQPFLHIRSKETIAFLKRQIGTGYYENLLKTYLLENQHAVLLIMRPEAGMTEKMEAHVRESLKLYKEQLTKEELAKLVKETKELKAYQQEPSKREDLEKIPMLSVSDIKREVEPLYNQEVDGFVCKVLHHNVQTNGIGYFRFLFDVTKLDVQKVPFLSFLCAVLGNVDTQQYSLTQLSDQIGIHTGGIGMDTQLYPVILEGGQKHSFLFKVVISMKVLYTEFENAFALLEEIVWHSILTDEKRLKEILGEERSRMHMMMINSANLTAMNRAMSYHSKEFCINEMTDGIEYYRMLEEYDTHFEEKKADLIFMLRELVSEIFTKQNVLLSITGDGECLQFAEKPVKIFLQTLSEKGKIREQSLADQIFPEKKNEAFVTAGQVQYVARAGDFVQKGFPYSGALPVLRMILNYEYLWNQVRVLGGAYDCRSNFGRDGRGVFASYRDPNLKRTNDVYEKTWEYVRDFEADQREMEKYIIGTISEMDTPLTPSGKGTRSLAAYLTGITKERLQTEREQVLSVDVDTIRSLAPLVKCIMEADEICVIGGSGEVEKNKELFLEIKKL